MDIYILDYLEHGEVISRKFTRRADITIQETADFFADYLGVSSYVWYKA